MPGPFPQQPKHAPGSWGGKQLQESKEASIYVGILTRVDEVHMKADVRIITGGATDQPEVDLTQAMSGPRSFWGGIPEVNSLVLIGYRPLPGKSPKPCILGYLPASVMSGVKFDPFATNDPTSIAASDQALYSQLFNPTYRSKRMKLLPGDVGGMSSGGSELKLDKNIMMVNRGGDLIELRDAERLLITQAINQFHSSSGVKHNFGPIRRGAMYLPMDIFQGNDTTKPLIEAPGGDNPLNPNPISPQIQEHYFGQSVLSSLGPGNPGDPTKYCSSTGVVNAYFNNFGEFPPVTYSNARKVFFPSTIVNANPENPSTPGDIYVEHRIEIKHTTDAVQEVLDEIDGFNVDIIQPGTFIEHVMGTVVGNDPNSSDGMSSYGRVLKPVVFDNWSSSVAGTFKLIETNRSMLSADTEINFQAGAYLFKITPPEASSDDDVFAACISKQGKVFLNVPGSVVEDTYDGTKNVSAELNFGGGIKAFVGKEALTGESIHLVCGGSIHVEMNGDARGKGFTPVYNCSVDATYLGGNDDDNNALSESVQGNARFAATGDIVTTANGSHHTIVDGQITIQGTRININGISGYTLNAAQENKVISGQSQFNYGLVVMENIAAGGKVTTVLAGGIITNVVAGAVVTNVLGGAMSNFSGAAMASTAAGAMTQTAGGAMTMSAGGAIAQTAGGAWTATAGLAATMTAGVAASLVAPQCLLGGPAAVYGIARGLPMMPPGTPSLDWITGLPLQGCAVARSF